MRVSNQQVLHRQAHRRESSAYRHVPASLPANQVRLVLIMPLAPAYVRCRSRYLTDGNLAAIMGLTAGLLLLIFSHYVEERVLQSLLVFDSSTFLVYLLPPVILNAGLHIPAPFFSNIGTILCMGIGGEVLGILR